MAVSDSYPSDKQEGGHSRRSGAPSGQMKAGIEKWRAIAGGSTPVAFGSELWSVLELVKPCGACG